jgi:hypothetical protein
MPSLLGLLIETALTAFLNEFADIFELGRVELGVRGSSLHPAIGRNALAGCVVSLGMDEDFGSDEFLFYYHHFSILDRDVLHMFFSQLAGQDSGDDGFGLHFFFFSLMGLGGDERDLSDGIERVVQLGDLEESI